MNSRTLIFTLLSFSICAVAQAEDAAIQQVPAATAEVASRPVLVELARQLNQHFNQEGDLQLTLLRPWTSPVAESAAFTLEVVEYPAVLAPSMLVHVRLQSDDRALGEHTLMLRAQLFRDVWAARDPLERAAALEPAQLDIRRVDVLREREALPVSINTADFTIVRSVTSGRLLTWRDVARRALVRKGEVIEISATDGMLSITMKGVAMENGAAGELVRVRNMDSKKEFSALVVADARAQVRF